MSERRSKCFPVVFAATSVACRKDIGAVIRQAVGDSAAKRIAIKTDPDFMMRLLAHVKPELRHYVGDLGYSKKTTTNEKARRILHWTPRPAAAAISAAAKSLIAKRLLKV